MNFGGDHYKLVEPEPILVIEGWLGKEKYRGYLLGNILKYLARYERKGGVKDLEKASDYLGELIKNYGNGEGN